MAVGVVGLDHHAVAIEGVAQSTQGHGEPALIASVAPPLGGVDAQGMELGRAQVLVADHVRGVAATLETGYRLPDGFHAGTVERERP